MARLIGKNWPLNSYANGWWTALVAEPAVMASLVITNLSEDPVNLEIRVYDTVGEEVLATLTPTIQLSPAEAAVLDIRAINVMEDQELQVRADAAGLNWFASGAGAE